MGWGFRRSVSLFPGVRLNFSRGGISTTIGVRGASINIGKSGSYVNLGLAGTGLSYREKLTPGELSPPASRERQPTSLDALPPIQTFPERPLPGEIRSGAVSEISSPGLGELKRLINEAAVQRLTLTRVIAETEQRLQQARRRLDNAQRFFVRLFTQKQIPRLASDVRELSIKLQDEQAQLAGCEIDVSFAFDDATLNSFAALVRAYEELRQCAAIWDITSSVATNRVAERTVATNTLTRTAVRFDFGSSEIINSADKALMLGNANGEDIFIYPGFVMMCSPGRDFALLDVRELTVEATFSRMIEEEQIPPDSEVIGQTWAKTNRDGSPDRRFRDNCQIPIVLYGELVFRSDTGLNEAYMFSNFERTRAFAAALSEYQTALTALANRSEGGAPMGVEECLIPIDQTERVEGKNADLPPLIGIHASKPRTLFFDWVTLVVVVLLVVVGLVTLSKAMRAAIDQSSRSAAPHSLQAKEE